jgi:hypothetical protein
MAARLLSSWPWAAETRSTSVGPQGDDLDAEARVDHLQLRREQAGQGAGVAAQG